MEFVFKGVHIRIIEGDALSFQADTLILKFANAFYGVDHAAAARISTHNPSINSMRLEKGEAQIFSGQQSFAVSNIIFVGVGPLYNFEYSEIRNFSKNALEVISEKIPYTRHAAFTLHGVGYGLDERESFKSEIAGFLDAITAKKHPKQLQTISIVEHNPDRAARLNALLGMLTKKLLSQDITQDHLQLHSHAKFLEDVSTEKPYIFVAMPFSDKMDDVFHYGIDKAINDAGFLCERADMQSFTGDVVIWIKNRIEGAEIVVADLSGSNQNVYLEVGYAWGCGKKTILLTDDINSLMFDVQGQRCIHYKKIKDLETKLRNEISKICKQN